MDEIINIELADLNDLEQSSAKLEAILIMTQVQRWKETFDTIGLAGQIALIARDILYRGLIETLGSRLERNASWERFKEDLQDVPVEVVGLIPGIPDWVGKMKLLVDMGFHLMDKEKALQDDAANLIKKHNAPQEFIQLYTSSLEVWINWAVPLSTTIGDMLLRANRQLGGDVTDANQAA